MNLIPLRTPTDPSKAKHKSSLYDPYYKSMFWATETLNKNGIVAFVINNSWIHNSIADAFRTFLTTQYSQIYLVDLQGDIRKARFDKGNNSEGENVFGQNSQNGIVIAIMIKNGNNDDCKISYAEIGESLPTMHKLSKLADWGSVNTIKSKGLFKPIKPSTHADWINPRIVTGDHIFRIGDKSREKLFIFFIPPISMNP